MMMGKKNGDHPSTSPPHPLHHTSISRDIYDRSQLITAGSFDERDLNKIGLSQDESEMSVRFCTDVRPILDRTFVDFGMILD